MPSLRYFVHLVSPDGRYVVFGELEDVTADPFKAIAAKIKTDGKPTRGPKDAKVTKEY